MKMRLLVVCAFLSLSLCLLAQEKPAPPSAPVQTGSQVPSPDFLAKFDQLRALAQTVGEEQAALKVLTNKIKTLNDELVAEQPAGYQFDASKRMFVEIPKPEVKKEAPKEK